MNLGVKDIPFLWFLVHWYFIIVEGLYRLWWSIEQCLCSLKARRYEGVVRISVYKHSLGSCRNTQRDKTYKRKLVYKRNTRVHGKLECYLAKTIVKGYSLKLCFNYGKPFQKYWSYSNLSNYSYLLQCISFIRYNNQTFS